MIEQVEISGFRLLKDFSAEFSDLNVVIGANASGKSTVIQALQFVRDLMLLPIDDALSACGGSFSIPSAVDPLGLLRVLLRFHRPRHWERASLPVPESTAFTYEFVLGFQRDGTVVVTKETLAYALPAAGESEPLKLLDVSPLQSMVFDVTARKLVPFDSIVQPKTMPPVTTSSGATSALSLSDVDFPTAKKTHLRLAQMQFYNEYPLQSYIRYMLSDMVTFPGFSVGRNSFIRTEAAEIRPSTLLAQDGRDLGMVLHELFSRYDHRDAAQEFREFVRAAYPEIEDITAETSYGAPPKVLVRTREIGMQRAMEVWDLSDGTLRFLCLAAALLNPLPPTFIALDEPELGLHPRLIPIVADMIKVSSSRTQVLITTHSPDLLAQFDLSSLVVMRRNGPRALWSRPGNKEILRQLLEPVGTTSLRDLHRSGELEVDA